MNEEEEETNHRAKI